MRKLGGLALFVAGTVLGIFVSQPTAAPQKKTTGMRLNHFGIFVKNMDESKEFYTKKMGFREAFSFTDAAGKPVIYLQMSRDTFLEMTPADANNPAGFSHAGIWADDVNATVTALKEEGVKVEDVHAGMTKAQISNLHDPNGVRIELLAYPPDSLQSKAINAWK